MFTSASQVSELNGYVDGLLRYEPACLEVVSKAVTIAVLITSAWVYQQGRLWHFGDLYIKIIACLNELYIHCLLLYIFM